MRERINPRRRPLSQADIERAKKGIRDEAVSYTMTLFLTVLCDKHGATDEELKQFWQETCYLSESVSKGYVSLADLRRALRTERGIEV